jgi:ABC-type transport system involved in multi-copper enzyme maturation permease subunit
MHDAVPALLSLCRREFDLTFRAGSFRWPCLVLMLMAAAAGSAEPQSAAMGVYSAQRLAGPWFGFLALFWATAAASRDRWGKTEPLILSKPVVVEGLVAARFVGMFGATALGLALVFAAGAVGQAIAAGRPPSLLAVALRLPPTLPGLFYLAALGFTLSLLLRSPLAAAAAALYWILVLLAGEYVARVFNATLPQNGAIYALAGLGIALLAVLLYQRRERGSGPWTRLLAGATIASFAGSLLAAVTLVSHSHDVPLRQDELALATMGQPMRLGKRAPGFWLPDQDGKPFGLHLVDDQILLIGFWSPDAPESLWVLDVLAEVEQQFGGKGVTPVAVCLTEDHSVSAFFAHADHHRFPMVTDVGTRWSNSLVDTTPVAAAYELKQLPGLFLTDRERRVRRIFDTSLNSERQRVVPVVYALLREEPQ